MRFPAASDAASRAHFAPPRRGRVRKRYVILIIALLLTAWAGWKLFRIVSAKANPLVDYTVQFRALSESAQPEGENGWPALSAALARFDALDDPAIDGWPTDPDQSSEVKDLKALVKGPFEPTRVELEIAYVEFVEGSDALREVQAALEAPRFVRTVFDMDDYGMIGIALPEVRPARAVAKVRRGSMRLAAERGDTGELLSAFHDLNRLAAATTGDPCVLSHMVAKSIVQIACEEMNCLLIEHEFDAATCRALLKILPSEEIGLPLSVALEGDRLMMRDLIQRTHTDDGNGDGLLIPSWIERLSGQNPWSARFGSVDHPIANVIGIAYPSRAETRQLVDAYMDAAIQQARYSRAERHADPFDGEQLRDQLPERQVFGRFFLPFLDRVLSSQPAWQSRLAAMRIAIAIEMYEAIHGRLPETLDALAPECIEALPIDAVSGLPFGYVQREPTVEDPRTYLLYSVGVDLQDHGAVEFEDDPTAALIDEVDGAGYDYIFNRLREPVEDR
ncbi:MAG: hypothetical protein IT430_10965 [Phycisphaerales bacterium]|nr:hypothetical protein [Phycisphaerales bacterium]